MSDFDSFFPQSAQGFGNFMLSNPGGPTTSPLQGNFAPDLSKSWFPDLNTKEGRMMFGLMMNGFNSMANPRQKQNPMNNVMQMGGLLGFGGQ